MNDIAFTFPCNGEELIALLSGAREDATRAALVVVGGPQYRVGSHRQFALLARYLGEQGFPAMRIDYRGMGDASGTLRTFEMVDEDLAAALDALQRVLPSVREVVLWGLCDAASAILFYAHKDPRVSGCVLLNPWVRTEQGAAKAYLKQYYARRLVDPELWRKITTGKFDYMAAGGSFLGMLRSVVKPRDSVAERAPALAARASGDPLQRADGAAPGVAQSASDRALPERMLHGFARFKGRVLLILSGDDLTAREFKDVVSTSRPWRKLLSAGRVTRHDMPNANHTFSRRVWRDEVARLTEQWLKSW